jgi:hypothetical protein
MGYPAKTLVGNDMMGSSINKIMENLQGDDLVDYLTGTLVDGQSERRSGLDLGNGQIGHAVLV